jgi:hypothetical protein
MTSAGISGVDGTMQRPGPLTHAPFSRAVTDCFTNVFMGMLHAQGLTVFYKPTTGFIRSRMLRTEAISGTSGTPLICEKPLLLGEE